MSVTQYEDLGSTSSPLRFTWPKQFSHGSSPLARQERPSSSSFDPTRDTVKLPPFHDVFEAAAEPPPPYTELPRVPHASFYALAYDRPLNFQHHVVPVVVDDSKHLEMNIDDELQYLGHLTIEMSRDYEANEAVPLSPTSASAQRASSLGPWRTPSNRDRRSLLRRKQNPAGQRALECLRMNFILENVPHLANGLRQFEDRASTPVADVFYDWYDVLSADQRVKYMPWFVPERLDLVRSAQQAPSAAASETNGEKSPASSGSTSQEAAMAAAAQETLKRKEKLQRSPPRSYASLPGWEELDQAVRWLRVLPNRQKAQCVRKDATIRAWKTSVNERGWTQWDHQLHNCCKWRDVRQDMVEEEWKSQAVSFRKGRYSALIFPSSWRQRPAGPPTIEKFPGY